MTAPSHVYESGLLASCKRCGLMRRRQTRVPGGFVYGQGSGSPWSEVEPECESPAVDKPWRSMKICIIDTETTGLDWAHDEIVEIGLVAGHLALEGGVYRVVEEARWQALIKPREDLLENYAAAAEVTGISWEMLKPAPSFTDVAIDLYRFLDGWKDALFGAFNARFDHNFVAAQFLKYHFRVPPCLSGQVKMIDPLPWSRGFDRYKKGGHKLTVIAERYGLLTPETLAEGAHRADFDARLAFDVIAHFAGRDDVPEDLDDLLDWQEAMHAQWALNFFGKWRIEQRQQKRLADAALVRERQRVIAEVSSPTIEDDVQTVLDAVDEGTP